MKSEFEMPPGLPAHACGRCLWWRQIDKEGWGKCRLNNEKRWYKCMVCSEYEMYLSDEKQQ